MFDSSTDLSLNPYSTQKDQRKSSQTQPAQLDKPQFLTEIADACSKHMLDSVGMRLSQRLMMYITYLRLIGGPKKVLAHK